MRYVGLLLAVAGLLTAGCAGRGGGTATPSATSTTVPAAPAVAVYRGDPGRRTVALTFDVGGGAGHVAGILATLRRERVRASFVVTGLWAEQHRDLLLAIAADGHLPINGGYHGTSFTGASMGTAALTAAQRALELSRTETTVYHLSGRTTRPYFRAPHGDVDTGVLRDAGADGYGTVVMSTVDTLGWRGATADAIVRRCLSLAEPGAIYEMSAGAGSQDAAALAGVIEGLRAAGYSFGGMDEVMR